MPERRSQNSQDHDLLVALHEQVKQVRIDIKEIKDGTAVRIEDHETRIRFIEKYVWGAVAVIGILNFIGLGGLILLATKLLN